MKTKRVRRVRQCKQMTMVFVACLLWLWGGTAQSQTPTALLSKLKRLQRDKKTYQQHRSRHAAMKQKYERMVRMHSSETKRYSAMYTTADKSIKQVYLSLSRHHRGLALRYARMARSAQAQARRDARNATSHLSKARRYQATAKKHAQTAYQYLKKSGQYKFDLKLDQLRKQPLLRVPTKRPTLRTMPRVRPQILAPSPRR